MVKKVFIRPAKKQDCKEVINLFGKFVLDENRYKKKNSNSFHKFIKSKNSFVDVAIIDGKIVGFITYSIRTVVRYPESILEVEEFFVLEKYRRLKIGKQLMEKAINLAKKKRCYYVFLGSSKDRVPSHKFYKHMGFDEYGFHYRVKP